MTNNLKWAVIAVMMACGGGMQAGGDACTKDTDCKGSRVCDNGECVDPSGGTGGGSQSGSGGGSQSGSGGSQSGSGGGSQSGSGGGTHSGTGGGTQQAPQCFGGRDTDCPTGYWCNQKQCQATTLKRVGESCTSNSDCAGDSCIYRNENDIAGYCSKLCASFAECPAFWDCSEIANAAGTYCVQSGN